MQLVQPKTHSMIEVQGIPIAQLSAVTVNAIRVWTDARGKAHFDYGVAIPTRQPETCAHHGTWVRRGKTFIYTWARSDVFQLRCGDCGTALA